MYRVIISVPYEGDFTVSFETLDEVREWIRNTPRSTYEFSYDNIEILKVEYVDVYSLMEGK